MNLFGPPNIEKMEAKRDIKGLIKALSHKQDRTRWEAATALGKLGDARAVEPLITALKDNNNIVRNRAAEALGKLGDARAVEPLVAAHKDKDKDVRFRAIDALVKLGDSRAVELLSNELDSWDWMTRSNAARALGDLGDARAVEPLRAALKDEARDVRLEAAKALERIGWAPILDDDKAWNCIAREEWDQCALLGSPAVKPLSTILNTKKSTPKGSPIAKTKIQAVKVLGKIDDPSAVEPLITALKDMNLDAEIKIQVVKALWKIGDSSAVEPLITALKDMRLDKDVRLQAAEALAYLYRSGKLNSGDKQAILVESNRIRDLAKGTPHYDEEQGCQFTHHDHGGELFHADFPL
jgi:HEAT repeat protein